jgi:hypothetical protein
MRPLTMATMLAIGLTLSGCAGMLEGPGTFPDQEVTVGSYNTLAYPAYGASDYYARPAYVAPYAYQPAYITPYAYAPVWGEGRDRWRDREWREHQERSFQNEGRLPLSQQRHDSPQAPQMAIQRRPPPQMAPQPSPAPRPQADQNRKLLDQLGFRPSR